MHLARFCYLPFLAVFSGCVSTLQTIPDDWLRVPRAAQIRSLSLTTAGKVSPSSQPVLRTAPKGSIRAAGNRIHNGDKALTEAFEAIDSFDLSESRGEVVFSVRRDTGFDLGLVAVEGSDISWVPNDPADEVGVQWAPRGNKISYVVRTKFGDVVRTLHIPTSASFAVDFPFSRVNALAWEPQAERFAVAYSSPTTSDAVDVLEYSGERRSVAVKPAITLNADVQPLLGDAILIQPLDLRYNEKVPLVIWRDDDVLAWNDARAELMRNARVAIVVTNKPPDAAIVDKAGQNPIIDASRTFVVEQTPLSAPIALTGVSVLQIRGDSAMRANRYRRDGNVVTVPAAVVESFAARFIAEQLKRNAPPNGSSR
jgi:hypothetical protein